MHRADNRTTGIPEVRSAVTVHRLRSEIPNARAASFGRRPICGTSTTSGVFFGSLATLHRLPLGYVRTTRVGDAL